MAGKGGKSQRIGKTDAGRVILTTTNEEPKSIRANKRYYRLWKLLQDLNLQELQYLITKRKNELRHEKNTDEIRILRTEILIIKDTYKINKRKLEKEEK